MSPNSNDLAVLVPWIINHGYLIFAIVAVIEGPFITIAAGVASALGYFNIFIILALALFGDIGGDFFYYWIGYLSHKVIHSPFFRFLGLSEISPIVGPLGIVVIGATRVKFRKFIRSALYVAIPKSLFFALLGYYSGQTYLELNKIISRGQDIIPWIILFVVFVYFIYMGIMRKISKVVE